MLSAYQVHIKAPRHPVHYAAVWATGTKVGAKRCARPALPVGHEQSRQQNTIQVLSQQPQQQQSAPKQQQQQGRKKARKMTPEGSVRVEIFTAAKENDPLGGLAVFDRASAEGAALTLCTTLRLTFFPGGQHTGESGSFHTLLVLQMYIFSRWHVIRMALSYR